MPSSDFNSATGPTGSARLLEAAPHLATAMDDTGRQAIADLIVSIARIDVGSWSAPRAAPNGVTLGMLITDGALLRQVDVPSATTMELLGAGDLIRPWQEDSASFARSSWRVLQPTSIVVLDTRFESAIARCPGLSIALLETAMKRSRWLVVQAAISQIIGIERRVLLMLWHIAEKWGTVRPDGVEISVPLTHELIAEISGATRTYVTEAFGSLVRNGDVVRRQDGHLVLCGDPPPGPS